MNLKDFYKGNLFDCYNFFGAHKENDEFIFRTYAPTAKEVMIFGSFNDWKEEEMKKTREVYFYLKQIRPPSVICINTLSILKTVIDMNTVILTASEWSFVPRLPHI